jgi:hypothetical protein
VCTCLLVGGDRPGQKIGAAHLRHIPLGAIIASAASFWSGEERREEMGAAILRQMASEPSRPSRSSDIVAALRRHVEMID